MKRKSVRETDRPILILSLSGVAVGTGERTLPWHGTENRKFKLHSCGFSA